MNIKEAKIQIERAVGIYLTKDKLGNYRIPIRQQRPVYLLGAPGIGKTAIVEQAAREMDLALVTYSMTHHTRQSALGLPFIVHKEYRNHSFDISQYTMSEIVASVYETIEKSGKNEGILFLDEINCVSETLAPSMLQFLQYKTFGRHQIPEGWVIITAGNPPQYNRSVREFDMVTLDRVKLLEVEAAYQPWREYAVNKGLHGAVMSYLDIRKSDFYVIENTPKGRSYVTARGWEDLSKAIYLYEENGYPVEESLIQQYLHHQRISGNFINYYQLYAKYKKDYAVDKILAGEAGKEIARRAVKAGFDERLSLMALLFTAVKEDIAEVVTKEKQLQSLLQILRRVKKQWKKQQGDLIGILDNEIQQQQESIRQREGANTVDIQTKAVYQILERTLKKYKQSILMADTIEGEETDEFSIISSDFSCQVRQMKERGEQALNALDNVFAFVEDVFGDGHEMLVLVTDLTVSYPCAYFINQRGCKAYFAYSKKYRVRDRQQRIEEEMELLEI